MGCDQKLVDRLRSIMGHYKGTSEQAMFGGVCFMMHGHMCCGVAGDDLVVRLGEAGATAAVKEPHARPMDFTGKPMKTMVYVAPSGIRETDDLRLWVRRGVEFCRTLPPKPVR